MNPADRAVRPPQGYRSERPFLILLVISLLMGVAGGGMVVKRKIDPPTFRASGTMPFSGQAFGKDLSAWLARQRMISRTSYMLLFGGGFGIAGSLVAWTVTRRANARVLTDRASGE